jgi:hypothetical protein
MSADPQHDNPDRDQGDADPQEPIRSPFSQALETWDEWSMAASMRRALRLAHEQDDRDVLARFERYPEWTKGPGPLEALRANRELVDDLTGWRWLAMRDAREQGHGWQDIGRTLEQTGEQARAFYLAKVHGQRWLAEQVPQLGYDPRWLELAADNHADRAELERRAIAHDDPGCPPAQPRHPERGREAGHDR